MVSALTKALQAKGVLPRIRAALRKEIYDLFEPKVRQSTTLPYSLMIALIQGSKMPPKLPNETLIINELIRQYFEFQGYDHTLAVFMDESGQPEATKGLREMLDYQFAHLEQHATVRKGVHAGKKVPLLYPITAAASVKQEYGSIDDTQEDAEETYGGSESDETKSPLSARTKTTVGAASPYSSRHFVTAARAASDSESEEGPGTYPTRKASREVRSSPPPAATTSPHTKDDMTRVATETREPRPGSSSPPASDSESDGEDLLAMFRDRGPGLGQHSSKEPTLSTQSKSFVSAEESEYHDSFESES